MGTFHQYLSKFQVRRKWVFITNLESIWKVEWEFGGKFCNQSVRGFALSTHVSSAFFISKLILRPCVFVPLIFLPFVLKVVHCDLKAANILTTKTGNVKLSDFGVSLNLRAMEQMNNDVAGTPNWSMSFLIFHCYMTKPFSFSGTWSNWTEGCLTSFWHLVVGLHYYRAIDWTTTIRRYSEWDDR